MSFVMTINKNFQFIFPIFPKENYVVNIPLPLLFSIFYLLKLLYTKCFKGMIISDLSQLQVFVNTKSANSISAFAEKCFSFPLSNLF